MKIYLYKYLCMAIAKIKPRFLTKKTCSIVILGLCSLSNSSAFSLPEKGKPFENRTILTQAQNIVAVFRWWNNNDKDWINVKDGEIEDWKLGSWGYQNKQYSFSCSLIPFSNSVPMYRWWNDNDKDWITVSANEIPEAKMYEWGYRNKTFQCYVSLTPLANGVAVYRWWNANDKDWLSIPDGAIPEYNLGSWGYQNKTFQFYAYR